MATQKTARRRSWGTLRTMRNGSIQASYIYDQNISVSVDAVDSTRRLIAAAEQRVLLDAARQGARRPPGDR